MVDLYHHMLQILPIFAFFKDTEFGASIVNIVYSQTLADLINYTCTLAIYTKKLIF